MRPRNSAEEGLGILHSTGLELPGIPRDDPRWQRLRFSEGLGRDLRDRFRGALLGGAIGDAIGRANEGLSASEARARRNREFEPWAGWRGGPKGTITDDTQLTMWLAEAIVGANREPRGVSREPRECAEELGSTGEAGNRRWGDAGAVDLRDYLFDPDDLARRFTREWIRGMGQAVREFVHNYVDLGMPWYEIGVPSAGNGTAMCAAAVGLVHLRDPYRSFQGLAPAIRGHPPGLHDRRRGDLPGVRDRAGGPRSARGLGIPR